VALVSGCFGFIMTADDDELPWSFPPSVVFCLFVCAGSVYVG